MAVEMDLPFRTANPDIPRALHAGQEQFNGPMSIQTPHAFDRLPAELLTLIISQTDSPKDLSAFIATCQRTHRVFEAHKTQVLEAVIRNAFPDTQLREAVGACKTWPLKAAYDHGQWVLLLPAQQWFLRQYWLSPKSSHVNLKEPGLLPAMYRLWWVLDHFIRSFFEESIEMIATEVKTSDLQPGWNMPLDQNERCRIQRALLRFELYRQLFPPIDGPQWFTNDWPYRSTHQYTPSLFLRQLPHWERGELLAVSQHLYRTIRTMHLRIRSELLQIIPPEHSYPYEVAAEPQTNQRTVDHIVGLYERMIIFPEDHERFRRHYSCIARLGLPFINWLQTLSTADQVHIFGLHWVEQAPKTIESEISYITKRDMSLEKWMSAMESSLMDGPSVGWREVFNDRVREEGLSTVMTCSKMPLMPRPALQKMGYLFWSDARFSRISFPELQAPDPELFQFRLDVCDFQESLRLKNALISCAKRSEMFEDLWQSLKHSDLVERFTDCFTRSYPPREILECIPIYYGITMDDAESAEVARQFMHERRELVNELVSRLSDIWLELVTTGPR